MTNVKYQMESVERPFLLTGAEPAAMRMERGFIIDHVLRPHWKALCVAFVAVIVEGVAGLFDPWPIKIVLDYALDSHSLPAWMDVLVRNTFGESKFAIIHFAAIATVVGAAVGAVASYTENYL